MDSNISEISKLITNISSEQEVTQLFDEILTESEISVLTKRWRILSMLAEGKTQRDIAKDLNVSLCKVTRGAKILKDKNAIVTKYLMENKNHDNTINK